MLIYKHIWRLDSIYFRAGSLSKYSYDTENWYCELLLARPSHKPYEEFQELCKRNSLCSNLALMYRVKLYEK